MGNRDGGWGREEQLIQYLGEFGLNRNEARLYLVAYGRPSMRAAELAELAGINRPKAYDALRVLVDKGLFVEEPGPVARFLAVEPVTVVQRLRQQTIADQANLVEDTSRLIADLFARYYRAPLATDPFDLVEVIRNAEAAWARCEAVAAGAEEDVVRARKLPVGGAGPPGGDRVGIRPGIRYRVLYERGFLDDPQFRAQVAERERHGEAIRFTERVAIGLCVVDRRKSVLSLNTAEVTTGPGSWIVLEHPALAMLLTEAFEVAWATARTVAET
jgi:DNA-binding MarR family transcriptional regulator